MEIFYIGLLTVFASTIGTMTGFGTSTIMVPVLAFFLPPIEAIFLVAIIHWFGDLWKITFFRSGINLKLIALFSASGILTSFVGAYITLGADQDILLRFLGALTSLYTIFLFVEKKFQIPANAGTALGGGALSGFFAGMFGVGGTIRGAFLSAFNLPKAVYIATAGAIGIIVDSTRIVAYFTGGAILPSYFWYGLLLFIPLSFLGANIAKKIINRIPQEKFRFIISIFLLIIGLKLFIFP